MSNYFEKQQEKAIEKNKEKTALNCIELGKLTLEKIAKCTGLTLRRLQALAKTL